MRWRFLSTDHGILTPSRRASDENVIAPLAEQQLAADLRPTSELLQRRRGRLRLKINVGVGAANPDNA